MANAFSRRGFSRALFAGIAAAAAQPTFASLSPSLAHALNADLRTRFDIERIGRGRNRTFQVRLFAINTTKKALRVPVWGTLSVQLHGQVERPTFQVMSQATMRELMSRIGPRAVGPQEIALPPMQERLIATYTFGVEPEQGDEVVVSLRLEQRESVGLGAGVGGLGRFALRGPNDAPAAPPEVREGALHGASYRTTLTLSA